MISKPALLTICLCLLASALPTMANATQRHEYRVSIDPALSELSVIAQLSGPVRSLRARNGDGAKHVRNPRLCDGTALKIRRERIRIGATGPVCVRYEFELDALPRSRWASRMDSELSDRLVSPSVWLWRPLLTADTEIRVSFDLPDGVMVSVPWEAMDSREDHTYRFGISPGSSDAVSVFGAFDYREIEIPGATLRVSLLRSEDNMNNDAIVKWLRAAATDVTLAYGHFPNPSPQVIVVPVGTQGRSAVPFGRVIRDGGEAVQFFVNQNRPLTDYLQDWTATHEFAHLLFPYVEDKWISEGFATYYQNVLLARAGVYSERRAWQKLYEGFERGRKSSPRSSPVTASMRNGGVMKIYWSGAAIALLADAHLRESSGGTESLDTVVEKFGACCVPSERSWRGREFFAALDSHTEHPVFVRLYDHYANAPGFPDLRELLRRFGVRVADDQVRLANNAPASELRRAIMAVDSNAAAARGQ